MAFCEVSQDQTPGTDAYAGDFGFKVLTAADPAEKTKKLNAEIANGRLAMMAIIGMFFQVGCGEKLLTLRKSLCCVSCTLPGIYYRSIEESRFEVISRIWCRMPLYVCMNECL